LDYYGLECRQYRDSYGAYEERQVPSVSLFGLSSTFFTPLAHR
jgi:hypothetical protein